MGIRQMGPPENLVLALRERMGLVEFVETGTFHGHTSAWAASHFQRVATIELSPEYHAAAVERFRTEPRVRVWQGESPTILRTIVPGLAGPTLFWLDAHWSGLDTAGREKECPLLDELAAVNLTTPAHVVLVDDARLFCAPPPRPHRAEQWPELAKVVAVLGDGGRRHVTLFGDVFIAVPQAERPFVTEWLQNETTAEWNRPPRRWWQPWRQ